MTILQGVLYSSDGRWADQAPATPVLPGHEADTAV